MHVAVEVCATSLAIARKAAELGADAVELCTWLASGGVAPDPGLVAAVQTLEIPTVRVLVRPLALGFVLDADERVVLQAAMTQWAAMSGAPELVVGALLADGRADHSGVPVSVLASRKVTFHKAIDAAADPLAVVDDCKQRGYARILTSGVGATAMAGTALLRQMVERAGDALVIAAAGSITGDQVVELVEKTGVREVHFAGQAAIDPRDPFRVAVDERRMEAVFNALVKAHLR